MPILFSWHVSDVNALINFNSMATHLKLFYAQRLRNYVNLYLYFMCNLFLHSYISSIPIECKQIYLVWFYGISTIVGYLMPNPFYTYIKYMISKHILKITFLNKPEPVFLLHTIKWFHLILNSI